MDSAAAGGARELDIAEASDWAFSREQTNTVLFIGGGIGGLVVGSLFVLPSENPDWANWGLAIFIWAFSALFLTAPLLARRNVLRGLSISPEGLVLRFDRGPPVELRWGDPTFGLTLRDLSVDNRSTDAEKAHIRLWAGGWRVGALSRESGEDLVEAALAHGVPVHAREEFLVAGKFTHNTITIRIGAPEKTPGWAGGDPGRALSPSHSRAPEGGGPDST